MSAVHSSIRTLIVEDEPRSRDLLRRLLDTYCPDVQVVGEAATPDEAAERCEAQRPDLVLLDIELAGGDAFSLLQRYTEIPFRIIFTTSYDQYAIRAIRYAALDYLLKPLVLSELRTAIERFRRDRAPLNGRLDLLTQSMRTSSQPSLIALPTSEGYEIVQPAEIIYCEASGNYTIYYPSGGKKLVVSRTLKDSELLLHEQGFLRIHQSYLINLSHVRRFVKTAGGSVIMRNNAELTVSPRRKEELLNALMRL